MGQSQIRNFSIIAHIDHGKSTRSVKGWYDDPDYDLSFDNTGKNGHYREFAWSA